MSQLWWWCCCRFLFWGAQKPVSFRAVKGKGGQSVRAVKGKGGESALELSCSAGNGGESASGGCEGGMM